jgi:hypothetical protein
MAKDVGAELGWLHAARPLDPAQGRARVHGRELAGGAGAALVDVQVDGDKNSACSTTFSSQV